MILFIRAAISGKRQSKWEFISAFAKEEILTNGIGTDISVRVITIGTIDIFGRGAVAGTLTD